MGGWGVGRAAPSVDGVPSRGPLDQAGIRCPLDAVSIVSRCRVWSLSQRVLGMPWPEGPRGTGLVLHSIAVAFFFVLISEIWKAEVE